MTSTAEPPRVARHTTAMLGGQLTRVALQGGYFVVLARGLGASDFGAVAAILALTAMLVPFSNLGAALLMLRAVSREPASAPVQWANTVALTALSGGCLALLLIAASAWIAPEILSPWVVATVALSELIGARLVEAAGMAYQAQGFMGRAGSTQAWLQAARLATLSILLTDVASLSVASWAVTYLAASLATGSVMVLLVIRRVGLSRPNFSVYRAEWRSGMLFALGMSSQTIYNDVDKALLAKLSTLNATGIYSAAYRIIDMSYVPMRSLIAVVLPAMMRAGEHGIAPVLDLVRRRLALPAAIYCTGGMMAMILGANLMPVLLGDSYEESVGALQLLAVLLVFKGLHFVAADTLTCAGHQGTRTLLQITIAALNVLLCLTLIPLHSYTGAIVASLTCDGLLAITLWAVIVWKLRARRQS